MTASEDSLFSTASEESPFKLVRGNVADGAVIRYPDVVALPCSFTMEDFRIGAHHAIRERVRVHSRALEDDIKKINGLTPYSVRLTRVDTCTVPHLHRATSPLAKYVAITCAEPRKKDDGTEEEQLEHVDE